MQEWVVLTFIRAYEKEKGKPPRVGTVASGATSCSDWYFAHRLLVKMQKRKLIKIEQSPLGRRSIRICVDSAAIAVYP